jgi:hypothetical protein
MTIIDEGRGSALFQNNKKAQTIAGYNDLGSQIAVIIRSPLKRSLELTP